VITYLFGATLLICQQKTPIKAKICKKIKKDKNWKTSGEFREAK
jgi:hypothetical protein